MINGLNLNYDFVSQRVAIVNESGVITSAYLAIQPDENKINPRFVLYLLKSYDYQQVFHGLGSGIRKTLKYQDFKKIMIVAPTLSKQQAIADYLDETCSKIDEIIAEAKASIDEYKGPRTWNITNPLYTTIFHFCFRSNHCHNHSPPNKSCNFAIKLFSCSSIRAAITSDGSICLYS